MKQLFCDCKTDDEKANFFLSGRAVETGIVASAISNDVAMAYHRCAEFQKEIDALRAKIAEMEISKHEISEAHNAVTRRLSVLADENTALRAKVEQMEKQEPVAWLDDGTCRAGSKATAHRVVTNETKRDMPASVAASFSVPLGALPGAQAHPAPNAVAYLDLGVGGYMDIGTDLTDEELATLPKGRHMLGIVGTYGVDGYVPAQNTPSVPEGWEKELFCIQHAMAMNNWNWDSDASNDMKRAAYAAVVKLLAAAPEAKP